MKPFMITTAINYTNGPPHLGHFVEALLADILARFHRLLGKSVFFLTGTDEHGLKIEEKAKREGKSPQELCDFYAEKFQKLNHRSLISYDCFLRTTEEKHQTFVLNFFRRCEANGDIYLGEYEGWYDEKEETYVSEIEASRWDYQSPVTGFPLRKIQEPSYFFRLSHYQEKLLAWHQTHKDWIFPFSKGKEIRTRLKKEGLWDLSISRSRSLEWGISIPKTNHVIYVWFDALLNYISANPSMWEAEVHIIGKDILWFHSIIWPAMLFSAGLELPKSIYVHGFVVDSEGVKMSKSLGNVVSPEELLEKYPLCAVRYYFAKEIHYDGDTKFQERKLVECHDLELLAAFGNLVYRVLKLYTSFPYIQNPEGDITSERISRGKMEDGLPKPFDLEKIRENYCTSLLTFHISRAVKITHGCAMLMNEYINHYAPWKVEEEDLRNEILRNLLEGIVLLTHFYLPFVPDIGQKVFETLGIKEKSLPDLTWRNLEEPIRFTEIPLLFSMLDREAYKLRLIKNKNKSIKT